MLVIISILLFLIFLVLFIGKEKTFIFLMVSLGLIIAALALLVAVFVGGISVAIIYANWSEITHALFSLTIIVLFITVCTLLTVFLMKMWGINSLRSFRGGNVDRITNKKQRRVIKFLFLPFWHQATVKDNSGNYVTSSEILDTPLSFQMICFEVVYLAALAITIWTAVYALFFE